MLLFYVRHGDPIYNPDSLTPLGKRQAEAVAKRLSLYGIDEIYASTSNRAIMTATPTSEILRKDITKLDFCNEGYAWRNFTIIDAKGNQTWAYQDANIAELFVSEDIYKLGDRWYEHPYLTKYEFRDWYLKYKPEMDEFLLTLGFKRNEESKNYEVVKENSKRIALFAHEGFGMIFLSYLLHIPYPMFCTHFGLNHSGMTVIHFDETKKNTIPRLLTISNDSHLYREGLPTTYNYKFKF